MGKYQFITAFKGKEKNNSAYKLRYDNRAILEKLGYKDCTYYFDKKKNKLADAFGYYLSFIKLLLKFRGDIVVMQYPLADNFFFNFILRSGKLRGVTFTCIIIDIESVRSSANNKLEIKKEIDRLNSFSILIAHNMVMKNWLLENGCKRPVFIIDVFDYLSDKIDPVNVLHKEHSVTTIAFAGNLHKSRFINGLNPGVSCRFLLYGFLKNKFESGNKNVQWMGEFKADEIINIIDADWGLIWDGNETEYLDDKLGKYLRFNTPHKTSLYIVCGLPLIVPVSSAIAAYIKSQRLGICIDKLSDCNDLKITKELYNEYRDNVLKIRTRMLEGLFLYDVLQKATKNNY